MSLLLHASVAVPSRPAGPCAAPGPPAAPPPDSPCRRPFAARTRHGVLALGSAGLVGAAHSRSSVASNLTARCGGFTGRRRSSPGVPTRPVRANVVQLPTGASGRGCSGCLCAPAPARVRPSARGSGQRRARLSCGLSAPRWLSGVNSAGQRWSGLCCRPLSRPCCCRPPGTAAATAPGRAGHLPLRPHAVRRSRPEGAAEGRQHPAPSPGSQLLPAVPRARLGDSVSSPQGPYTMR